MKGAQQALPGMAGALAPPERRCDLCSAPLKPRHLCKRCRKGGWGEPPPAGGPAWSEWIRGLMKTCRAKLSAAGVAAEVIERTIEALFLDRGVVPLDVRELVRDYDERTISPRRHWRAIDIGVMRSQLAAALVRRGRSPEEADAIAERAAPRIVHQQELEAADPEAPRVHPGDILFEEMQRQRAQPAPARVATGLRVELAEDAQDEAETEAAEEELQDEAAAQVARRSRL